MPKNIYIRKIGIITIIILSLTIIACQGDTYLMTRTTTNVNQAKISYTAFLSNCSTVNDLNITNATGVEGICGNKENVLTTWMADYNWSVTCCSLTDKCHEDTTTNFTELCLYNNSNTAFSWQFQGGSWIGLCCDFVTGLCYEQEAAVMGANNTCQTNFTELIATTAHNTTIWNSWCCISGGLE